MPAGLPYAVETYRPPRLARRVVGVATAALAGRPLQSGLYAGGGLACRLPELARQADLALVQLARLGPHVARLGATPYVVDLVDSLALSFRRRALYDHPALAPLWRLEGRRLARAERRLAAGARAALVVAERDRLSVAAGLVPPAPPVVVVPLAIGDDARPPPALRGPAAAAVPTPPRPPRLVITGNLGYFPTREGTRWWLEAVWPALRAARPELELVLAGARSGGLARAARRAGAEVLDSPPDLGAVLAGAGVALAPMRAGAGQPLKVMEAWAAGVPVVAHPWAAAGTTGRPGEELLVAEEPADWCAAIGRLLDDPPFAARLIAGGRRRLAADYSRAAVAARLEAVLAAAGPDRR